jgi:superfamily I DNA/RNA helicase
VVEGPQVVKLEWNYRSDRAICHAASHAHRAQRAPGSQAGEARLEGKGRRVVKAFENIYDELEFVAGQVRKVLTVREDPSIAVLFRLNFEVKRAAYAYLMNAGLPVTAPQLLQQRPHDWERAILLLSLTVSPENEILAERYLKLDHDSKQVERWMLERRAGNLEHGIEKYIRGMGQSWARLLFQNGVSEGTVDLIRRRSELLPPTPISPT